MAETLTEKLLNWDGSESARLAEMAAYAREVGRKNREGKPSSFRVSIGSFPIIEK